MIPGRSLSLGFVLFVALVRAPAADVALFVGPSGGAGSVLVLDEHGGESWPARLQGIVLLPIECTGRTRMGEFLPENPRLRLDVPGAARLRLPSGRGSLYRYRRDEPGAPSTFGFFVVDPDGGARSVFERPGTGVFGTDDPLATHVAVTRRGDAIAFATRRAAGGDLIEVDLLTGSSVNRTAHLPPLAFCRQGVCLRTNWGIGLTRAGPLRFSRAGDEQASAVPAVPAWPAWTGADVACSADESSAAVVAGDDPDRSFVYVFGPSGPALRATRVPMHVSGAGFLPEWPDGPTLALSPDGGLVAWCSDEGERDCWVREVRAPSTPDLLVTGDENFEDTLDDTGVIAFFSATELCLMVGERAGDGMDEGDLFRVAVGPAGSLDVTNLSGTGPSLHPPFTYGRVASADGVYQLPGAPAWLAFDRAPTAPGGTWVRYDWSGRSLGLVSALEPPRPLEVTAGDLFSNAEIAAHGTSDRQVLLRLGLADLGTDRWQLPGFDAVERRTASAARGAFAAVLELPGQELLRYVEPGRAPTMLGSGGGLEFGPTLGFAGGALHVTLGHEGEWAVLSLNGASTTVLRAGLAMGFVLPGS